MLTRLTPLDGDSILPLPDAKLQCKVTISDDDTLIAGLRDAAIIHIERVSGVAFAETDYRWTMQGFPCRVDLPVRPVTALGDVSYNDETGASVPYTGARLVENSVYPSLTTAWPYANGYAAIEFTAGPPADVSDLLAAVKLLLTHLYDNRGAVSTANMVTELPLGVSALIGTHVQLMA